MTKTRSITARALSRLWFRTLRVEGPGLPAGPVLVVVNHPNGLLDPLVVSALVAPSPCFLAKSTLWRMLPLRPLLAIFQAIPVERAQDTDDTESRARATAKAFAAVHRAFEKGERVGLFPEGISHGNAWLAPLKTGAARMALSSRISPALVPAGLVYGRRELFRHNALLRLGAPIEYGDLVPKGDDPGSVIELTARIRQALLPLTLHGPEEALQRLAEDLAWLLAEAPQDRADLETLRHRTQSLLPALAALGEGDRAKLRSRVDEAHQWLQEKGLRPDQVGFPYPGAQVRAWIGKALLHHGFALLLAPAALLFWPPYRFIGWLANRLTDELDQTATYKLLGGLLFMPAWAALLLGLAIWLWGLAGAAFVPALAILAFLSLPLSERLREDWQAIRGYRLRRHPDVAGLMKAKEELLDAFPQLR
ncbi:MAG: 1-acyl-sn-glycerol-3-phosphate acyltransferase [Holophagaceae bacterium]|nr:1-acyl-sn-glycerol-3-phosphate acyltransferase [Holophagaceae bacterium]